MANANVARDIKNEGQDLANQAAQSFDHYAREAGNLAGSIAGQVSKSAEDYYKSGVDYVKENPVKGMAMAAAVGAVAATLFTKANRKN